MGLARVVAFAVALLIGTTVLCAADDDRIDRELLRHVPGSPLAISNERGSGSNLMWGWANIPGVGLGRSTIFVIDLPGLDSILPDGEMPHGILPGLEGVGVLFRVTDRAAFDNEWPELCKRYSIAVSGTPDALTLDRRLRRSAGTLRLHAGLAGDVLALGFSPAWVERALGADPSDRVEFADGRSFVDLTRLRSLITHSKKLATQIGNASRQDLQSVMSDAATVDDRDAAARRVLYRIIELAIASDFPVLVQSDKERETQRDMRSIGSALESYMVDFDRYPDPTGGWVDVDQIAPILEPSHMLSVPRVDAWGHPYRFWSNGNSYLLVSTGSDGVMDRDWRIPYEEGSTTAPDADIVFDRAFTRWPAPDHDRPR